MTFIPKKMVPVPKKGDKTFNQNFNKKMSISFISMKYQH